MSLLVVGSVALDDVKTPFGEVKDALGGSATFFSVAASHFTEVSMVAVVGEDFPSEHIEFFDSHCIDTSGLTIEKGGKTFHWSGVYGYDLNTRETLDTQLNVFEHFRGRIPAGLGKSEFVFLANIDPVLQRTVLEQVESPKLVACDTMDFWINGSRAELEETLAKVDVVVINDAECRQLAGEPNLIKASRAVLEMGPGAVIVKKGEHGSLLLSGGSLFNAPAFPCEDVHDPTGAGDSFAGGFMGYLAGAGEVTPAGARRAVIYGTVMASFCVEDFSVNGMTSITREDIEERFRVLEEVTRFEP